MNQQDPPRFALSEGLIIALVPAVAYALAYLFEIGFCSEFNLPTHLIQVGIVNVLITVSALIAGAGSMFWLIDLLYMILAPLGLISSPVGRSAIRMIAFTIFVLVLILLLESPWRELRIWIIIAVSYFVIEFLPLLTRRGASFHEKLAAQEVIERKTENLADLFFRRVGRLSGLLMFSVLILLFFSHAAGRGEARRQCDFLVPVSDRSFVVLRQFGDQFILGRLSHDRKSVLPEFRILIPASSTIASAELFELKRIGPLSPAPFPPDSTTQPNDVADTQPVAMEP